MKKLMPLLLVALVACNEHDQSRTNEELQDINNSVEKGLNEARDETQELVNDIKEDSLGEKIENKIRSIGDSIKD